MSDKDLYNLAKKIGEASTVRKSSGTRQFGRNSGRIIATRPRSAEQHKQQSESVPAPAPVKTKNKQFSNTYKPRIYTLEEQKELLQSYEEVPKQAWSVIEPNTHIRYRKIDGKFVRGGFVVQVIKNGAGKEYFKITTSLGNPSQKNYSSWTIAFTTIKNVWKKTGLPKSNIESGMVGLHEQVKKLSTNMNIMIQKLTMMNGRVSTLETKFNMLNAKLKEKFGAR